MCCARRRTSLWTRRTRRSRRRCRSRCCSAGPGAAEGVVREGAVRDGHRSRRRELGGDSAARAGSAVWPRLRRHHTRVLPLKVVPFTVTLPPGVPVSNRIVPSAKPPPAPDRVSAEAPAGDVERGKPAGGRGIEDPKAGSTAPAHGVAGEAGVTSVTLAVELVGSANSTPKPAPLVPPPPPRGWR